MSYPQSENSAEQDSFSSSVFCEIIYQENWKRIREQSGSLVIIRVGRSEWKI